jgi:hypothetical protein
MVPIYDGTPHVAIRKAAENHVVDLTAAESTQTVAATRFPSEGLDSGPKSSAWAICPNGGFGNLPITTRRLKLAAEDRAAPNQCDQHDDRATGNQRMAESAKRERRIHTYHDWLVAMPTDAERQSGKFAGWEIMRRWCLCGLFLSAANRIIPAVTDGLSAFDAASSSGISSSTR